MACAFTLYENVAPVNGQTGVFNVQVMVLPGTGKLIVKGKHYFDVQGCRHPTTFS